MTKKKYLLVKWTNVDGEHEYCGHTVLVVHPRKKDENAVHGYFQDFWGLDERGNFATDKEECVKCESYMYFGGEVAVKDIQWKDITEEEYLVLKALSLAH